MAPRGPLKTLVPVEVYLLPVNAVVIVTTHNGV